MATLVISDPKHGRMEVPLIADIITVGRMNDNTIQIRDDSVSGRHAKITRREDCFHLEDLGSANRCFLEEKEVSDVDLTRDCTLRFGDVSCEFHLHGVVSNSIEEQFSHFQKQIQSILADRDEALRKRGEAMAECDQIKKQLETLYNEQRDPGKHVSGMLQELATAEFRIEELACDARNLRDTSEQAACRLQQRDLRIAEQSREWESSERSENLGGKDFDSLYAEMRTAKADAAALRVESMKLRTRAEFLARQIDSLSAQRDALQRANDQLNAQLAEAGNQIDYLTRRHEKVSIELNESKADLHRLISGVETVLSRFERIKETRSSAATKTSPPGTPVPSGSTAHSDTPRGTPPYTTGAVRGEKPNKGSRPTAQIDPSPAISPAVLAGRGFTPGGRDSILPLVADMRRLFASFSENCEDTASLDEILRDAYNVTQRTAGIDSNALFNLASALEALIRDVRHNLDRMTNSVLKTIADALDQLELMLDEKLFRQAAALPTGRTGVIENDSEIRNAVLAALKTVNLEPKWSSDPSGACSIVKSRPLDLILIDRACKFEDGQDPIPLVRSMPLHSKTPIIAIQDPESPLVEHTHAVTKPFNQRELAVKSLILIFKGQLGLA